MGVQRFFPVHDDLQGVLGTALTGVTTWTNRGGVADTNRNVTAPTADHPAWNYLDSDYGGKPTVGNFDSAVSLYLRTGTWNSAYSTYSIGVIGEASASDNRYFTYQSSAEFNSILNSSGAARVYAGNATPTITGGSMTAARSIAIAAFNGSSSFFYTESTRMG